MPKWAYLAQNGKILVEKRSKSEIWEFSPRKNVRHFLKDQKIFGRNRLKQAYLVKNDNFDHFWQKRANFELLTKNENRLILSFSDYFMQEDRKIYSAV